MNIKQAREKTGLSQLKFVKLLADTEITIRLGDVRAINRIILSSWENGRRNPDKLIQLAVEKILKDSVD